ncbi:MAG: hypothetical protein KQH63_19235 [Desulfobulbaceae bacterium]|nr:hypothetical protein [Desulfobulbaceae bacterium]
MRLFISLILTLLLVQPAMAQSWFQRMFGSQVDQSSFTVEERQQIMDYFAGSVVHSDKQRKERGYDDDNGRDRKHEKSGKGKGKKKKQGKNKGLPPGLAKKDTLPPGLEKQLEKNGTLPPGLAKRDLPADLQKHLPRRHKDHERIIVGDDVLLVEKTTGLILDVMRGVMRGGAR